MSRRILVCILGVIALVALCVVLVVWDAFRRSGAVITKYEDERNQFFANIRGRDPHRPSPYDSPIPADAWDSYDKGFALISKALGLGQRGFSNANIFWKDQDNQHFFALFSQCEPGLQCLTDGLKSDRFSCPFHYENGSGMDRELDLNALYTARLLEEAARRLHTLGQDRAAMNLIWVAVASNRDVSRRGGEHFLGSLRMVEWESVQIAQEILAEHSLTALDFEQLCQAFDKADQLRPSVREELGIRLMMEPMIMEGDRNCRPGWKSLFNRHLHRAVSLSQYAEVRLRLDELFSLPPEHRANEAMRRKEKSERPGSGDEALAWGMVSEACYQDVFTDLNFTLMRTALALAWHQSEKGTFPEKLEDLVPKYLRKVSTCSFTGTALRYAPGKVWSIGYDGKDDGGKPISKTVEDYGYVYWSWRPIPGDVVWVVKKK